jgi:hypothetical protein
MISRNLLVVGGLALIVSVTAFPSFTDNGLQSLVSWSLEADTADRVRREGHHPDCDAKCQKRAEKAAFKKAKAEAREKALAAKEALKTQAREAKQTARENKVAAKLAAVEKRASQKQAQRDAKADQRQAKVDQKEAAREAKKADKAAVMEKKAKGKVNARLAYKKLDKNDNCVAGAVMFMTMMDMEYVASGTIMVTKPADAPNNAGWYVLADMPKRHGTKSVTSSNAALSFGRYPALTVSGFSSWCDVDGGSGWVEGDDKIYTTDVSITYKGHTSAALWTFYYCYAQVGDGDDEELTC